MADRRQRAGCPSGSAMRALAIAAGLAAAGAVQAKVYRCVDPSGRPTVQDTACPVINAAPVPPPPPPCALTVEQRQRAVRAEGQFLGRFPDEPSHRRAQLAELTKVATKLDVARRRYDELRHDRQPIEDELAFYKGKLVPPALQARVDASDARFTALRDVFANLEQVVVVVASRYRCERATFGKLWEGAAPGASACARPGCGPA